MHFFMTPVMVFLHIRSQSEGGQPLMHILLGHLIWTAVSCSHGGSPHSPELSCLLASNFHNTSRALHTLPLTHMMELKWAQTEIQEVSLKMKNGFFTVKVTEHWQRFLKEVMESAPLEIFRRHLYVVLGNHLWVALLEHGSLGPDGLQSPSLETVLGFCKSFKNCQQNRLTGRHAIPLSNSCFHMAGRVET